MELEQYKIYVLSEDGSGCAEFRPGSPIVLDEYVYSAQRMGTATLTATVRDVQCLDSLWTGREFVCLDESSLSGSAALAGSLEKFFLLHTPSSSKSNDDERYVHTLEFVSERDVTLSSVYFLDAVPVSSYVPDKYRSNQFSFSFFGTLSEFVLRFNSVLSLRGLSSRFSVVLDCSSIVVDGVDYAFAGPVSGVYAWKHTGGGVTTTVYTTTSAVVAGNNVYDSPSLSVVEGTVGSVVLPSDEVLEVSFDKRTLFEALQDAFQVYKVPFWFEGDIIHFGEGSTVVPEVTFEYGHDEELLSIAKNNTNAKIVTRCTGIGGDTNIPYYYPNPTPKGTLGVGGTATGVTVVNQLRFSEMVALDETLTYYGETFSTGVSGYEIDGASASFGDEIGPFNANPNQSPWNLGGGTVYQIPVEFDVSVNIPNLSLYGRTDEYGLRITPSFSDKRSTTESAYGAASIECEGIHLTVTSVSDGTTPIAFEKGTEVNVDRGRSAGKAEGLIATSWDIALNTLDVGTHTLHVVGYVSTIGATYATYAPNYVAGDIYAKMRVSSGLAYPAYSGLGWRSSNGASYDTLSEVGLAISGTPVLESTITQTVEGKIPPQQNLMPSVYRSSLGVDRWYNAINNTYVLPGGNGYYDFDNEYNPLSPREYIQDFEDIYPTIRNLVDGSNNPLNVFDAVYFEAGYNTHDTVGENNDRKYSWFFARLKPLGFNLFDCAIENGSMTIEMIDGHCAGCKFAVLVDETDHNHVQVDGNGALVVGSDGRVDMSGTPQDVQNDTTSNYVWVCLQIDTTTYGDDDEGVMPGDVIRPAAGDPFVITNIALPQAFFIAAEEKLKHAILEFMAENNAEKYTYTIKFSRIWLAQHHDVRDALNEHAALYLRYGAWRNVPGVRLDAPLHIQQYTVRQQEGEPLPEVDVELTDEIEDSSGGLSEAISASVENIVNVVYGGGVGGGLNTALGDARYLRRDKPETVANPMTFQKGWLTGGFVPGLNGAALTVGDDGKTSIEVDRLVVREGTVLPSTTSTGGGESLFEIYEYDTTNHKYAAKLKASAYLGSAEVNLDGVFTNGFMSAGGLNSTGGGGGGEGSTVTWTQLVNTGTQIATISINGVPTDVYAPTGGGGGTVGTLNTNNATAQTVSSSESFGGTIKLHKVSKTGNYNDLLNRPTIPTTLKNPYPLSYNGKSYDGSVAGMELLDSDITGILGYTPYSSANPSGFQANVIESVKVNGTALAITNKSVNITVPTVNNATLTIQMNGASKGTFTANASSNKTIDLGTVITSLDGYVTDGNMEAYVDSVLSDFAPNSAVVHKTGNEDIGGNKTFMARTYFDDGFNVAEWSDIYCEGDAESLETALADKQNKVQAMGSTTRPVYVSSAGTFSQASTYAGGTRVTLNGTSKGASTASFYAPTASGTSGQYLVSQGSGTAPVWADHVLDIRSKSFLGSDANLNSIYDPSFGDLYGRLRYYAYVSHVSGKAGINGFPTSSNANALLTIDTYSDTESLYLYQMGFSANGSIYFRNGNAVKVDGNWVAPWNNGNWNRILFEDHNGDATTTRDLTAGRHLVVARGNMVKFDAEGTAYMKLGSTGDNSFYINAGNNGTNLVFYETSALCPNSDTANLGAHWGTTWKFWNNIYAKRWYPNPSDMSKYIEYDTTNGYFYVHGDLVVTGQVVAGQSA